VGMPNPKSPRVSASGVDSTNGSPVRQGLAMFPDRL
jgi:hypothetical protein